MGEIRPSLTLNLGTNDLEVTSEPPPMAGQAGCFQGQDRSAVTLDVALSPYLAITIVPASLRNWQSISSMMRLFCVNFFFVWLSTRESLETAADEPERNRGGSFVEPLIKGNYWRVRPRDHKLPLPPNNATDKSVLWRYQSERVATALSALYLNPRGRSVRTRRC
ncbi:hypothetical protein J6590_029491 [Homalodisca vitripennis]|nr:hypothetical protein J6590_029491 [Homalodisca vitripennis]